jgi:acyl-CoA synthetase (AMP-forming)/AMP-acid ligase II
VAESRLVHHLLDQAAARRPNAMAVTGEETSLAYGDLVAASYRLADWLWNVGLRRGDRLVMQSAPRAAAVALCYAASRIGVMTVILHDQTRPGLLERMLRDCEPRILIADDAHWHTVGSREGVRACYLSDLDNVVRGPSLAVPHPEPLVTDPLCLIYTSGSTSFPKAVVATHQQVTFVIEAIASQLGYASQDVIFVPLPLSFDYGLYQLFLAASACAHLWLANPAVAGPGLVVALNNSRATVFPAMPHLAAILARMLHRHGARTGLRLLTTTGATMSSATLAELRRLAPLVRIQLMYGLTECKRVSIMPPDGDLSRPGSVGPALPGTEVFTIDEGGFRLPASQQGELVVRGPHVMLGYWRRPDLTAQRFFRRDGLFPELRTGDYGWVDSDGYVYLIGRRDDIYKSHGFRVGAVEVESAACRIAGVEAAVLMPPTPERDEPVLIVASRLTGSAVLMALRGELEDFKLPARCITLHGLPRNGNGKPDRSALAAFLGDGGCDAT